MTPADMALLRRSHLVRQLRADQIAALEGQLVVHALPKDAVLFAEGEAPEFIYIVLSGRVGLSAKSRDRDVLVEFMSPGDAFLVPAVILDLPYLLTARTAAASRVALLPSVEFRRLVGEEHGLAYACAQQLSVHWRVLVAQIKDLKLKSGVERLRDYLLAQADHDRGAAVIELTGSQKLLAGRLGMTPETMSRALRQLRPLGVTSRGRRISIADLDRLRGGTL
jgi:CRP/FNR family transcriptional regulator, transcriptional activator FtrB